MKPLALDLFCCAGGITAGLVRAGFDVRGADITPHADYPLMRCEAVDLSKRGAIEGLIEKWRPDFVHASPPCQGHSISTIGRREGRGYIDLIPRTREALIACDVPAMIENVPGAPLRADVMLCGVMFGLPIQRHRLFEIINWPVPIAPPHEGCRGREIVTVAGHGPQKEWSKRRIVTVCGSGGGAWPGGKKPKGPNPNTPGPGAINWRNALDFHGTRDAHALAQAIPPAYGEWLGRAFLKTRGAS